MFYTIYKTTNLINQKIYIGKHQTLNPYDNYLGSGKALKLALKKYGRKNFKKEVLHIFDNEIEMNLKEREIVNEEFILRRDTYNAGLGGEGGALFKKKHSQETKDKLAEISRRQKLSEETKLKISALHKGRKNSEETIEKMKIARQKVVAEKKIKESLKKQFTNK